MQSDACISYAERRLRSTKSTQKMRAALMEVCIEITGDYIAQEEALVKLSKQIDKEEGK